MAAAAKTTMMELVITTTMISIVITVTIRVFVYLLTDLTP
jgi:hypothetical protein